MQSHDRDQYPDRYPIESWHARSLFNRIEIPLLVVRMSEWYKLAHRLFVRLATKNFSSPLHDNCLPHDVNGTSRLSIAPRRVSGKVTGLRWLSHVPPKFVGEFPGLEDAPFGDDAGDQFRRGHVERRIVDCDSSWCDRMPAMNGGDF